MKIERVIDINKNYLNFSYIDRNGVINGDSIDVSLKIKSDENLQIVIEAFKDLTTSLNDSLIILDGYSDCNIELKYGIETPTIYTYVSGRGNNNPTLVNLDPFDSGVDSMKIDTKYFEFDFKVIQKNEVFFIDGSQDYWGFSDAFYDSIRTSIQKKLEGYLFVNGITSEFSVVVNRVYDKKISRSVVTACVVSDSIVINGYRNSITDSKNPYSVMNGLYLNDTVFVRDMMPGSENGNLSIIDSFGNKFVIKNRSADMKSLYDLKFISSGSVYGITVEEIAKLELSFLENRDHELLFALGNTHVALVKTAG